MLFIHKVKSIIFQFFNWRSQNNQLVKSSTDIDRPPQHLIDLVGGGDYTDIGNHFFTFFTDLGMLRPGDRVLDIGCGVGRMAMPLTKYLTPEGSYEGFDIVPALVDWSRENITPRFPNFHFQQANIFNSCYNPAGKDKGSEFKFPFKNQEFDFIFLTSVFTHMLPAEMENYLSEIARVTKPGGRCLVTYFILNEYARQSIADNKSSFQFNHTYEDCKINDPAVPEAVVAYEEEIIKGLFGKFNLGIDSINYGSWSGRQDFLSFQDIIVLKKK